MKKIVCMTVCIALLVFLVAPIASAQSLDNQWFAITFKAKGLLYNPDNDQVVPVSHSAVAYLYMNWDLVGRNYDYTIYSSTGSAWTGQAHTDQFVYGSNEEVMPDWGGSIRINSPSNTLIVNANISFKIKKDSGGLFKSASLSSLSCSAVENYGSGERFFGGCTMKGKRIDPSKLPFTP